MTDFNAGYNEGYEQGFDAGYESAKDILEESKPEHKARQQYILTGEGITIIVFFACMLLGLVHYLIW